MMLFKKLFHMLVLGGAVVGTNSGCATTTTNADGTAKPQQSVSGNPNGALPGGGGVKGW
jgi:bifunctional N-acetylglucosamine-1-phosphate-uridyltransferase/glucosamine-1-phosphate-acetyltransferase GlmU-like protein